MFGNIFPATSDRVRLNTDKTTTNEIARAADIRINTYVRLNDKQIKDRLHEVEEEWDTEKTLEVTFASFVLLSGILGLSQNKKWFYLGAAAGGFMLMHALQGWCPPLPLIRSLGIRTSDEINREKAALKRIITDRELARDLEEDFLLDT